MYECLNGVCSAEFHGIIRGIVPLIIGGAMLGAAAIKAGSDWYGNRQKSKAAKKAAKTSTAATGAASARAIENYQGSYDSNVNLINTYAAKAEEALRSGNSQAAELYGQKADQARADLNSGFDKGQANLRAGYGQARQGLQSQADLAHYGEDALTGKGFTESGGYQFRLNQGQQALDKRLAVAGGRAGGGAMKALSDYNQNAASQEFGNWADRASNLGQVGYGAQRGIADYYAQEGQGLSNLDVARGGALGQVSANEGSYLSGLSERGGSAIANLYGQTSSNQVNNRNWMEQGRSNADLGQGSNIAQNAFVPVQYAGGAANATGQFASDAGNIFAWGAGSGVFGVGQQKIPQNTPPQKIPSSGGQGVF